MSLLNRISKTALCLVLPAGALVGACGAEGPESDPTASPATTTAAVERVDIGGGSHLEIMHDEKNGIMAVSASGPESEKARLAALGETQGGVAAIFRAALPDHELPAAILALDAKTSVAAAAVVAERAPAPLAEIKNPGADQNLGNVPKSAATFPGQFCNDQIDRVCNTSGWYWQSNGCYVNSTNDWSRTLNVVRQGYGALEVYRGSVTLRMEWWNGSAWVFFKDVPVNQGANTWQRLWSTTATPGTYKFSTINAAGDGYHVGVQSADTPVVDMTNKNVDPTCPPVGQRFNVTCRCGDAISSTPGFRANGVCLQQSCGRQLAGKDFPTDAQAQGTCDHLCSALFRGSGIDSGTSFQAIPGTSGCTPINPIIYSR